MDINSLEIDTSLSIQDNDFNDMIDSGLYSREWRLVGTNPPSESEDVPEHLVMFYEEVLEMSPSEYDSTTSSRLTPIVLNPSIPESVEILPVSTVTLGEYYNYFTSCVATSKNDQLVSICTHTKKSPCFDIQNCYLLSLKGKVSTTNFTQVYVGNELCVPLISSRIIENMIESLACHGISILPDAHDANAYNGSRLQMSSLYTDCEIDRWEKNMFNTTYRDFNRILRCKAVATATFTVSVVLSTVHSRKSKYSYRKRLTVVIHAIK